MSDIEIEIQVKVEKIELLINFLNQNGKFKFKKHQIDEYFTPAHRNFLADRPIKEWIRLREANGEFSINYKNWHFDETAKSHYADEYETKIENLKKIRKIFEAINFKSIVKVEKTRKVWEHNEMVAKLL